MSVLTTWGYTITDADEMPDMITAEDFATMTAGKFAGDTRIPSILSAACMGLRNYCGWHVYPAEACQCAERILSGNGRIKRADGDILFQLPAACVLSVSSVAIDGAEFTDFHCSANGLLRLFDIYRLPISRKTEISVTYTAGITDGLMASIREIIAARAARALSGTNGVASESAGGVSVSYNSSYTDGGGAGALRSTDVETLEPYKLREVF